MTGQGGKADFASASTAKKQPMRAGRASLRPAGRQLLGGIQARTENSGQTNREDRIRSSPRFWVSISSLAILSSLALGLPGKPAFAADSQVAFIFGGDVEWGLKP